MKYLDETDSDEEKIDPNLLLSSNDEEESIKVNKEINKPLNPRDPRQQRENGSRMLELLGKIDTKKVDEAQKNKKKELNSNDAKNSTKNEKHCQRNNGPKALSL